jgi:hypothetical protein
MEDVIENTVEGPQQKVEVHIPMSDFVDMCYPNHSPSEATDLLYEQIEEQLPEGEIKTAFSLAKKEREEQDKAKVDILVNKKTFVEGSDRYAFRGIKRKSDGTPMWQHPDATRDKVPDKLHEHGIDAPGSEDMMLPRRIWDQYALPTIGGVRHYDEDVGVILIYRNEPFVLTTKEGDTETTLIDLETREKTQISIKEAKEKKYPTLRDLFVGQIEISIDR